MVRARMADLGIGTLLHYPMAAHQMPAYQDLTLTLSDTGN